MRTLEPFLKNRDKAGAQGRLCHEYVRSILQYPLRVESIKERLWVGFPQKNPKWTGFLLPEKDIFIHCDLPGQFPVAEI